MSIYFPYFPGKVPQPGKVRQLQEIAPFLVVQSQPPSLLPGHNIYLMPPLPLYSVPITTQIVYTAVPITSHPRQHGLIPSPPRKPPLINPVKQLFKCIDKSTPIEKLKQHLDKYPRTRLNIKNEKGNTLMHEAVLRAHFDAVRALCDRGADPNVKDSKGKTPLHYACMINEKTPKANREIISILLKAGAKVNEPDNNGNTPLHEAAKSGLQDILQTLLKKDGHPSQCNDVGETPLDLFMRTKMNRQSPHSQSKNDLSSLTTTAPNTPEESEDEADKPIIRQISTVFELPDPLAEVRTSIDPKKRSIADLNEIQTLLESDENPFLKINWAPTGQQSKLKLASATLTELDAEPEQDANSVLEELELWLRQNPLIEPADQNPASKEA